MSTTVVTALYDIKRDINGDGRDEIVQKPGYTNTRVVNFLEPESDNSNLIILKSETLNIPSGLLSCSLNKDRKTGKASSTDYGLMQINSTHIPKLIKMGVIKKSEDLITKPCLNIHIGSWILARHFQICGVSWNCLGSYNAGFRKDRHETREQYANKIWRIYRDMKGICLPGQGGRQCRQS